MSLILCGGMDLCSFNGTYVLPLTTLGVGKDPTLKVRKRSLRKVHVHSFSTEIAPRRSPCYPP